MEILSIPFIRILKNGLGNLIFKRILYYESSTSILDRDLVVYFRQSGIEKQRVEIDGEIIKIVSISNNEYAIFSQFLNESRISIY